MKRTKQLRRIEWAMRNSRGIKKKKIKKCFDQLYKLSTCVWLKFQSLMHNNPIAERMKHCEDENGNGSKDTAEKIELNLISGTEHKSSNYYDSKGYLYTKNRAYKNHVYLRCKNSSAEDCPARAILKNNDMNNVVLVQGHNHCPEKKDVDKTLFDKTLQRISVENPTLSPFLCYKMAKDELKGKVERKHIPMLSSYFSLIHRAQKTKVPLLPKTIKEFEKLINIAKNHQRYAFDDAGLLLYRGVWQGTTGKNVAFVSERTLQAISKEGKVTLLMDGTFKSIPSHLKFVQLYIINVIIRDRCFPLAYVLMERRDFHSYMKVFSELKKLIPSMNVVECMSDYESATRKAILLQFPGARLSGCWFHYVQAIMKNCKRFGLLKYGDSEKFKVAVNKIAALALLPHDFITEAFESIAKSIKGSGRWKRFTTYWLTQWKEANISVYGLKHRTNNFSESLNRTINKLIGKKGPNIWKLILNLQSLEMIKSDELEQVTLGLMPKRKPKKKTTLLNEKIEQATKLFDDTENFEDFLNHVTFNDELAKIVNLRGSRHDDLDECDDDIVPNHYNKLTEFRKNHPRTVAVKRKRVSESSGRSAKKQKN